jgi:hypothetical protein
MTKVTANTVHSTRYRSAVKKKNDAAADNLQKIVAAEKRDREIKRRSELTRKRWKKR